MGELTYDQKAKLFGNLLGEALAYINPRLGSEDLRKFFILTHALRGRELVELRDFVCEEVEAICREVLETMGVADGGE